jgi:hypothetical protein
VIDSQPNRDREQTRADARETAKAYRSIWSRLEAVRQTELYHDKLAFKRAGITQPAKLYGRKQSEIDPVFESAMQRLWDIGTLPEGRADTELRRTYHLRNYFVDWDSFAAWTSALAKLSTFLSTTKAVTASLSAC